MLIVFIIAVHACQRSRLINDLPIVSEENSLRKFETGWAAVIPSFAFCYRFDLEYIQLFRIAPSYWPLINRSCCSIKIRTTADWPLWSCLHQLIAIHIYISPSSVVVRQWLMVGRVMGIWAHWMDEYYCMGTTSVDDSSTDNISYM